MSVYMDISFWIQPSHPLENFDKIMQNQNHILSIEYKESRINWLFTEFNFSNYYLLIMFLKFSWLKPFYNGR